VSIEAVRRRLVDQAEHRDAWVIHEVAVPDARDLLIKLVDIGSGDHTITADAISLTCHP
jgi:tRNA-binding EMAP/Myf-like protein